MKLLDSLHRWTGAILGLVLLVLGLSGALLVHRDAFVAATIPHARDGQIQGTAVLAAVTDRLMAAPAARPESITFASERIGVHRLAFADGSGAYVDQAGSVVRRWQSQWERPELWLFDLHHHLFAGDAGETVIGIAGLAGIFFVVSGTILWWRTRKTFAFRLWPARLSRPAIVRQHRDLGILVAPLLALSFVTGTLLVFRPLTAVLFGPNAPQVIDAAMRGPAPRPAPLGENLDWRGMIVAARALYPDAEIRSISLPRRNNGLITLRMRKPAEWLPNGRTTLWYAAASGRIVAHRDDAKLASVVKAYNSLYPLHAAKVGGLPYRLVITVSGLALAMLGSFAVWSFWFRRPPRPVPRPARVARPL